MDLHHEAVVEAHPRHLGQHLAAEQLGLVGGRAAGERAIEQPLACAPPADRTCARVGWPWSVDVAPIVLKNARRLPVRGEIAAPCRRVLAGERAERVHVVAKAVELGVDDRIGPVRGDDASLPADRADLRVMRERIERRFGRRQHLDVEPLEQRARPEFRLARGRR